MNAPRLLARRYTRNVPVGTLFRVSRFVERGALVAMAYESFGVLIRPGELTRVPRVLYLTSAVATMTSGFVADPGWTPTPGSAMARERSRVAAMLDGLDVASLLGPGDTAIMSYRQVDKVRPTIPYGLFDLPPYSHLIVPPSPPTIPVIGSDFLHVYVGAPSVSTPFDYVDNPSVVDAPESYLAPNLADLSTRSEYMPRYAVRVFGQPDDGLDDIAFTMPMPTPPGGDDGSPAYTAYLRALATYNQQRRIYDQSKARYLAASALMRTSCARARPFGLDTQYMGTTYDATAASIRDLIVGHWGLGG